MKIRKKSFQATILLVLMIVMVQACNLPTGATDEPAAPQEPALPPAQVEATATPVPTEITHTMIPPNDVKIGNLIFDVRSDGTAPEKRAPYGDSYDISRYERPFMQDMTYVSDMDIVSYNISFDANWFFISIELIGNNPNNDIGIHYGIEFDQDWDGYGDFIVWGIPPYSDEWTTNTVQVFKDSNHDTGGLSSARSDAPLDGNGYDTMIFDKGVGDDPDLAWMRMLAGERATLQFAVKKSLMKGPFMFGVVADAGLKDVGQFDYNDRIVESDAGSPEIKESYYPLKELFLLDNSCQSAVGFKPSGLEPKLCPIPDTPTPGPGPGPSPIPTCSNSCPYGQDPYPSCICWPG